MYRGLTERAKADSPKKAFGARLVRVAYRVELVDVHERCTARYASALDDLVGHAGDRDIAHLHIALLDLPGDRTAGAEQQNGQLPMTSRLVLRSAYCEA